MTKRGNHPRGRELREEAQQPPAHHAATAAASAEASVAERTAPEVQAQQAEVAQINASALGARRKRQDELLEQRRQAAQALVR